MAKMVYEQFSVWLQPRCNLLQQLLIVPHMFEHLDGDDPIKVARLSDELIHIGSDDLQIRQSA